MGKASLFGGPDTQNGDGFEVNLSHGSLRRINIWAIGVVFGAWALPAVLGVRLVYVPPGTTGAVRSSYAAVQSSTSSPGTLWKSTRFRDSNLILRESALCPTAIALDPAIVV